MSTSWYKRQSDTKKNTIQIPQCAYWELQNLWLKFGFIFDVEGPSLGLGLEGLGLDLEGRGLGLGLGLEGRGLGLEGPGPWPWPRPWGPWPWSWSWPCNFVLDYITVCISACIDNNLRQTVHVETWQRTSAFELHDTNFSFRDIVKFIIH